MSSLCVLHRVLPLSLIHIYVKVKRESKTLATITFQNFFNKFEKKAGMTGTALTEEKEFRDIYGLSLIHI